MDKEIVIKRKKSKSILSAFWMLLIAVLFLLPPLEYFFDISWIGNGKEIPLFVVILCILLFLVMLFCSWIFLKQIFNDAPVLTVNKYGIREEWSPNHLGLISWDDIDEVLVIPMPDYIHHTVCIILKQPERYFSNPKMLKRVTAPGYAEKYGHVSLTSHYFRKEFPEVMELINYYLEQHKVN